MVRFKRLAPEGSTQCRRAFDVTLGISAKPILENLGLLTPVLRSGYGYQRTSDASLLNVR